MKYKNASDILPDELLKEIQKYAAGETIYIPMSENDRKEWGSGTGARTYYTQRNEEIRYSYYHLKESIYSISEKYHLSVETVRKIIYK